MLSKGSKSKYKNEITVDWLFKNKIGSLEELGQHYGFTRERARQILNSIGIDTKVFSKIRQYSNLIEFKKNNPSYEPEGVVWKQAVVNGEPIDGVEVSEYGEVRDVKRKKFIYVTYEWYVKRDLNPCKTLGYVKTNISGNLVYIHRVVAETFLDREEGRNHVNHIDGSRDNNYRYNLEWCTHSENIRHAIEHTGAHPFKKGNNAKSYIIHFDSGDSFRIHNMKEWCRSNTKYSYESVLLVLRNKQKTYKDIIKVEKVEEDEM